MTHHDHDAMKKLNEMLEGFDVGMLVTHNPQGELRARPMVVGDVLQGGRLSFVTSIETAKVSEAERDRRVCVTFQSRSAYVSLTGTAVIRADQRRLRDMWRKSWDAWFPDGPETPDVVLLEVDARTAELWDGSGLKGVRYLVEAGKALLQGERVDAEKGVDHEKVQVQ